MYLVGVATLDKYMFPRLTGETDSTDAPLREGHQPELRRGGEVRVLRQDPDRVAEGAGAGEADVPVETVPTALVGVGERQRRGRGVDELVLALDPAVHDLDVDVLGCERAQGGVDVQVHAT